jgi:plasmid stability protein
MAAIQIRNLSETVMGELRDRARHFHRPLEEEAASLLTQAVMSDLRRREMSSQELIDRARKVREGHPDAWVTEEFLRMAKDLGRP